MRHNEKGYQIFCHLKMAEQIFEQQYVCLVVRGRVTILVYFRFSMKMLFIFLKMGQTAVFLCFYSDDGCGHFVTISCFMAVYNQRQFCLS